MISVIIVGSSRPPSVGPHVDV